MSSIANVLDGESSALLNSKYKGTVVTSLCRHARVKAVATGEGMLFGWPPVGIDAFES